MNKYEKISFVNVHIFSYVILCLIYYISDGSVIFHMKPLIIFFCFTRVLIIKILYLCMEIDYI